MQHLALIIHNLEGGGMQRVTTMLLRSLTQLCPDLKIDLVVASAHGEYREHVPAIVNIIDLECSFDFRTKSLIQIIPKIHHYLQNHRPQVILSCLPGLNCLSLLASLGLGYRPRIFLAEHTLPLRQWMQQETASQKPPTGLLPRLTGPLMHFTYPWAKGIIAVSDGIAAELQKVLGLRQASAISVIYNPVVDAALMAQAEAPIPHPWLLEGQAPVFLAVGRLARQKDYPTLIGAFHQLRQHHQAKLIILGEGELREQLEALIAELSLTEDVLLLGFQANPYAYMSRAKAFILASRWETFGMVLVEALACGCPVISTDCNYGPREILGDGVYGTLVPVGNVNALAIAMHQMLQQDHCDRDRLRKHGCTFTVEQSTRQYLELLTQT